MSNHSWNSDWKERVDSLSIDAVVEDDRAFKSMLGIGEDAFAINRLIKVVDEGALAAAAAGAGGAVAAAPVVAGTFFPVGGIMGLLGLGVAVTPIGWVIAGAAAAGVSAMALRRVGKLIVAGTVEVIPRFINSPIDLLAASLFDVMVPLLLKVAHADGEFHDNERQQIREYLTKSWGYNQEYVDLGLECVEANLPEFETEHVAREFAGLCKENRDCNLPAITLNLEEFLQELIMVDGRVNQEERHELNLIRQAFQRHERSTGDIWNQAGSAGEAIRAKSDRITAPINGGVDRVAEDLVAAGETAKEVGGRLLRRGASAMARRLVAARENLRDLAKVSDRTPEKEKSRQDSKPDS